MDIDNTGEQRFNYIERLLQNFRLKKDLFELSINVQHMTKNVGVKSNETTSRNKGYHGIWNNA